ncbi:hypothetical protein QTP70_003813 [Hemibagrus guttatus]|uniref:Uncharacterized protein n=1 Tax=Hemibagrus guttatus TaxID=175788 RepID=A0AAE0PV91_9TELE|nr:hypothetical protein QTP70_003813 [Hemibagrus guttatus]
MSVSLRQEDDRHPMRPLLSEAGVAATVAGAYRYIRNNVAEDSVQDQAVGPVLDQTPHKCCRAPELEDRVRELERLLREANRECKQQRRSRIILQAQNNEKKKICQQKMFLQVSLADAQQKHQKALESISQLEEEKSELINLVNTLFSREQEQGEALCHSQLEIYELQNVSLADAELKNQGKGLESVSQLEQEKSELTNLVNTLRSTVEELGETLCNCHFEMDELQIECEQKQEAHSALPLEYEEIKKELTRTEEVLKVSLADAELKNQKALESSVSWSRRSQS